MFLFANRDAKCILKEWTSGCKALRSWNGVRTVGTKTCLVSSCLITMTCCRQLITNRGRGSSRWQHRIKTASWSIYRFGCVHTGGDLERIFGMNGDVTPFGRVTSWKNRAAFTPDRNAARAKRPKLAKRSCCSSFAQLSCFRGLQKQVSLQRDKLGRHQKAESIWCKTS